MEKEWIVTTSPDRPIRDIARDLEGAGFSISAINDQIQSITGRTGQENVGKMRSISGVIDVSLDEPVDIGPPDSPIS